MAQPLYRLRKNRQNCHPEEPQAILSETKEGSPHLHDSTNAAILRYAQDDSEGLRMTAGKRF
jgi:hypothetical protein